MTSQHNAWMRSCVSVLPFFSSFCFLEIFPNSQASLDRTHSFSGTKCALMYVQRGIDGFYTCLLQAPGYSSDSFVNANCWRHRITQKPELGFLKDVSHPYAWRKQLENVKSVREESGKGTGWCISLSSNSITIPWVSKQSHDGSRSSYGQVLQSWKT